MNLYQRCRTTYCGNREQGFTFIEVLFAVAVLAFGLLAVSSLQGSATRGNLMAFNRTEAVTWAQGAMEALMALPYDDPDLSAGAHTNPGTHVNIGAPADYAITWDVYDDDPSDGCKRIEVRVRYQEKGIQRRDVVLTCVKPSV